jgi:hypothetical protein
MFYMTIVRFPMSSSEQMGKTTVEALSKPLPDYLKRNGPYVVPTAEGVKSYSLYEAEKGHDEAFQFIADWCATFRVVEGYSVAIEPVLTAAEALSMLGLKL